MRQDKFFPILIILFLGISVVVGLTLVFQSGAKKKGEEEPYMVGKGIFGGMGPMKEGIMIIKVYGPIQTEYEEGFWGIYETGADFIVKKLKRARENRYVKAVVVRVNSPGGTVAASQEILEEIKKIRDSGKKVVVSMADIATSGAYYISSHANRIFADHGTLTGSIGVFVGNFNVTELAKKIGVDMNVIKSGKFKDILSAWRPMTEEEKELLQNLVNEVYEKFIEEVSSGRNIPIEKVREFADGRILTGAQARDLKLIDDIGGLQSAIEAAWKMSGMKGKPRIIKDYESWWENMFDVFEPAMRGRTRNVSLLKQDYLKMLRVPVTYLYNPEGIWE